PRIVGAVILWGAWVLGLVAVLAARPRGLTFARTAAPVAVVLALAAVIDGRIEDLAAVGAVAGTVVAAAFITDPDFALASVNGDSYGNERRFPLVTPPALYLGPLPVVRALAAAAVVAPALLLADEQWVAGAITAVVAVPIMLAASRAVRWRGPRPNEDCASRSTGPCGQVAMPPPAKGPPGYSATTWPGATRGCGDSKRTCPPMRRAGTTEPWARVCAVSVRVHSGARSTNESSRIATASRNRSCRVPSVTVARAASTSTT